MKHIHNLMPKGKETRRILQERAEKIAQQVVKTARQTSEESYLCFRLGPQEHYGLPYQHLKEVMPDRCPTPLPRLPSFIAGIINRRGALLTVLNLKQLFQIQPMESVNSSILIVSYKNMTLGILADSIEGSRSYDPSKLDAPLPSQGPLKTDYLLGLHEARIAILNIDSLLRDIQSQLPRGL